MQTYSWGVLLPNKSRRSGSIKKVYTEATKTNKITPARGHCTRAKEKNMNARELAEKHGVSHTLIYNMAKKLGRLPNDEEIENRNTKKGRPQKYKK